jgi:alkylation response protein AidB-like acyl-CoA dehydrogenase
MPATQYDVGYYMDTARQLAVHVAAHADRIDLERQLPPELAGEIADKGFFRLLMPRSLGGAELDHLDFLRILEVFAAADGSVAWCLNQNNVFATNSVRMPEQTAREIWGEQRAVVTNGPPTSAAKAIPVDGGYRLKGRWNFSSGSPHATWIAALTPVAQPGQEQDASLNREGARVLLIPKKDVKFLDLWQVNGLRGTGSLSFEVDDLFVPSVRTYDPNDESREAGALYVIPRTLLFATGFATVALGIARASLDTTINVAGTKTPGRSKTLLRDQPTTHRLIGEAEAIWRSARAFLRESASSVWESACKNHALETDERIRLRLASSYGIRMAAEVVDIAYNLCGSTAILATNPIQRRFQDIHVITQHIQGSFAHYETAGQHFLGLEPEGVF